jgi:hypothetical protein
VRVLAHECATYMALARAGLDVEGASVSYVAGWAIDDPEVIERDAREIDRIAARLEQALEGAVAAESARAA